MAKLNVNLADISVDDEGRVVVTNEALAEQLKELKIAGPLEAANTVAQCGCNLVIQCGC